MITVEQAEVILGLKGSRIRELARTHRIQGARLIGRMWYLPDAPKIIRNGTRGPKNAGA